MTLDPASADLDRGLDPAAELRRTRLREAMFGAAVEPTRVGRFVLLETLGAGGMGIVYAAYDPRLDRRIALKVVRPGVAAATPSVEARLLREAQAMARLSHPNVVQIHEVGVWEDRVYIAMELVAGHSLATWLMARPRDRREVVRVFVEAGRGLAAAHAVGIVHRDFKPENVMVGDDGRVRVTDFGLARDRSRAPASEETWREPGDPLRSIVDGASASTSAFAGTPRYMSPEQFLGEATTAASDQFSYCVALYQALHGVHPFSGEDRAALSRAVLAGERRAPQRLRIPRRIDRALVRGLARAPEARFPGMEHLLAEIDPRPSWKRLAPVMLLLVTGSGALGMALREDPCGDPGALLAGAWDPERRAVTREAFLTSGVADAEILWTTTARELDIYTDDVARSYTASCQAQRRGASSGTLHDMRVACLRRRVGVVGGVVESLLVGDPTRLRAAPQAALHFPAIAACEDETLLRSGMEPPPPGKALQHAHLVDTIDRASSASLVGDLRRSRALIDEAVAEGRALAYAPTLAEALYQRSTLAVLDGEFAAAEVALREALRLAIGARHEALLGDLLLQLIQARGLARRDMREADLLLDQAEAWKRRTEPSPLSEADLARTRALVHHERGETAAAEEAYHRVLELSQNALGPDHLQVVIDRRNHADMLDTLGHTEDALAIYRDELPKLRALVGSEHNLTADAHYNLAVALLQQASPAALAEAEAELQQALRIYEALHGPGSVELANCHVALAQVAYRRDDVALAGQRVAAALPIFARHPTHPDRAVALAMYGEYLVDTGRLDEALAVHVQARALAVARGQRADIAASDCNIADVLRAKGDLGEAVARYEAGITGLRGEFGPDTAYVIEPQIGLAEAWIAQGRGCEAVATLARAVASMRARGDEEDDIAEVAAIGDTAAAQCAMR